jgi:hypothetical protein
MSSRATLLAGVGVLLLAGAQVARVAVVKRQRDRWPKVVDTPYAPSPGSAPFVTLGYRETAADLFYIRAKVYFGGDTDTADGFRGLIDAIVTLDPTYYKAYELGARGIQYVDGGYTQDDLVWSTRVLEAGMRQFPDRWRLPFLAGQIYLLDLSEQPEVEIDATDEQIAQWRSRGLELLDRAIRAPGAPRDLATLVASVRTELGQLDRAARDLQELIQTTNDPKTRERLIAKLAAIQDESADRVRAEMDWEKDRFDRRWRASLPEAPAEMYLRLGDPPKPYIDLGDLAADPLVGADDSEAYEPLPDD